MPREISTPEAPRTVDRLILATSSVREVGPNITGYCLDCQGNCFETE